ncbi:MAG: 1-deoxy-D-xylulose-5-phosphate reductoisomerase [Planctomycetaceae bacterium]|nr:1-deoxy-D-xylulose-5-phosphate reductoisomerase [Planctomycetaceae bacterium]
MNDTPKRVALFGSTGSIGTSALDVLRHHRDRFTLVAIAARSRFELLVEQAREFRPPVAIITNPSSEQAVLEAQESLQADGIVTEFMIGEQALVDVAREAGYDIMLGAITGAAGLPANMEVVKRGKRLALANKESLVMTGPLLTRLARKSGAELLPVDSEHSAVWQCLRGERTSEVKRIILTASGGPFRQTPLDRLAHVTRDEALRHPTWTTMGKKITVDSATMMNKALEVIEARWLFDIEPERLDVVIHPQSIVHSMVEFRDGSVIAQLGPNDMRLPVQFALTYPERLETPAPTLELNQFASLTFETLEDRRFPAVRLGFQVARAGGTAGAVFNAANEIAVEAFLKGEIGYLDIVRTVEAVLGQHSVQGADTLDAVLDADRWAREQARKKIHR